MNCIIIDNINKCFIKTQKRFKSINYKKFKKKSNKLGQFLQNS